MKRISKRLLSLLLAVVMVVGILPVMSLAADETEITYTQVTSLADIMAGGDFVLVAESDGKYYALGTEIGSKITPVGVPVSEGAVTADSLPVWTLAASGAGVSLSNGTSYLAYGSSTNFKSSTDVYSWSVVAGNNDESAFRFTAPGPAMRAVAYGISQGKFGAYATTNTSGYVFDLLVFKSSATGGDPDPGETKVATPTAAPASGSTVVPGTTVTLSCSTEGATIKYNTTADTAETWLDCSEAGITIPDGATGTYTIYVKAVKDGLDDSDVLTLSYTVEDADLPPAGPTATLLKSQPQQLDKVYIYNPANQVVMTGTASGNKLAGVTGTVADDKLTIADDMLELVVDYDAQTRYYQFVTADGKYLTSGATGQSLTLADASSDYSLWTLAEDGAGYVLNNVNAQYNGKVQALEYFSNFTTFGTKTGDDAYIMQFYKSGVAETLPVAPEKETITGTLTDSITHGDQVVIYYPAGKLAVTGTASGSKLTGVAAEVTDTTLTTTTDAAILTVHVDSNGYLSFVSADGKYLTSGATGSSLTLADAASEYSLWTLEDANGGFYIQNLNAKYNSNPQYIEYYNGFTTYSFSASNVSIYTYQFYKTGHVDLPAPPIDYSTDTSVVESIAAWGGGGPYDESHNFVIYGDKYTVGDMLDTEAAFTVVANGVAAQPYQKTSTSTGGNNYYMGGASIGKAEGDYMQFAVSTAGWGDMELSFRLRATAAAPGSFQLQYSTDSGTTFYNFSTGEYSYSYTKYTSTGSTPVTGDGKITDGVARTSIAPTYYVTFTFDVPAGAENAEKLLIRLVAGTIRADGDTSKTISGNIRIDSVVLSGSPIVDDGITSYVTVTPDGVEEDQAPGTELTMDCATDGATIQYRFVNTATGDGTWQTYDADNKPVLPDTLPATLEVYATAKDKANSVTRSFTYAAGTVSAVKMTPNGGGVYIAQEGGTATITLSCDTESATIYYNTGAQNDGVDVYTEYTAPITLSKGFGSLTVKAYAVKDGFTASPITTRTFTERSQQTYNIYFGQMHSHTSYSDGAGTAEEAFVHATNVSDLDFLAVTDHSNSFDNANDAALATDASAVSEEWKEGKALAKQYTTDTFVGLFGFEMTWSNGLGHINTFNSPGFQSRTQSAYTTYSTALQNYYATLKTVSDSLSQFNHPGTTFGDFSDFAHYDEEIDSLITLIEVGNGEGAIGSSGYFPSYEYYTRALDKGWHVAPSNNQDNHKGNWGDSNTGRTVVLADELTEEAIYDAVRNYRVYATEDSNLSILYTLDGNIMGTILDGTSSDKATIKVVLSDKDEGDAEAKFQVIVNGGLALELENGENYKSVTCNETVTVEVPATYSYYYIKITQADGDIAVTAPVWLGKVEAVGISSLSAASELTVVGEEQTFTLDLYNNENKALEVTSVTFTDKSTGNVLHTDATISSVPKMGTASCSFGYTFTTDGIVTITATVKGILNGVEKTYTQDLEVTVMPAEIVNKIVVDGTHYNDYVTGYYGGNMGNMTSIAALNGVKVEVVTNQITAETLEGCSLLVISAPARKNGTANAGDYTASTFSADFIALVQEYVKSGGSVVVCGLADYQDKGAVNGVEGHAAAQINKLLAAIGSSMRINDDEVYDPVKNGGQFYRLYPENFNTDAQWTRGIVEGQTYSQYSGCSVDPGNGTWLVKGFDTTYSVDSDKDGVGNTDQIETDDSYGYNIVTTAGNVVFLACEDTAYGGTVFAAGGVFLSDFEVKAELDNIWDLPYANRTIYENILGTLCATKEVTPIASTRTADLNKIFVVEGYVTSGTTNENTTFFDAIYIQDETGGTTAFPYANPGLAIGTKVRIIGYTDAYQGDREIQILSLKVLDEDPKVYDPKVLSTKDAADYGTYGGQLVSTTGTVSDIIKSSSGTVSQFKLTDSTGVATTVFIDGYITNPAGVNSIGSWIREGQTVTAVGLLYAHPEGDSEVSVPVLRVRNCDEITKVGSNVTPVTPVTPSKPTTPSRPGSSGLPFDDVLKRDWFYEDVEYVYNEGIMNGTGKNRFSPDMDLTRGMVVTILYRIENEPAAGKADMFGDVPSGQWYTRAVAWAADNGIVNGYPNGNFGPNDPITREQLAAIMYRYTKFKGELVETKRDYLRGFSDVEDISDYAVSAMNWAVGEGLIKGSNNKLLPKAHATRAQVAAIIHRFLTK